MASTAPTSYTDSGTPAYGGEPGAPSVGTYTGVGYVPASWSAPSSSDFSPDYYEGSTDDFFRAISGAPSAPWLPGISEPPAPIWSVGGDMDTMTLDGTVTGSELAIGSPRVDESMQSRMSTAMLLPDGKPDYGKWVILAGVLVTLYLIGREMGRKGSPS